uniref:Aromatic-L-amino-acid decarboxylase n=1 Tax=Spongospora subterranea TaxID=70186 RepID=A0A0H5QM09_9EUKA|eukprot:CRZ03200.1 hypothetical protein [Spongospora subterranea]
MFSPSVDIHNINDQSHVRSIESYRVVPDVAPGYLASLVPDHAPDGPEPWDQIMMDYQRVIMPGMTHWQSPRFHAYFPAGASFPSLLADLLCNSIQAIGFR